MDKHMNGVEKYSKYGNTNFDLISINCNTEKLQSKYYSRWKRKYIDFFSLNE